MDLSSLLPGIAAAIPTPWGPILGIFAAVAYQWAKTKFPATLSVLPGLPSASAPSATPSAAPKSPSAVPSASSHPILDMVLKSPFVSSHPVINGILQSAGTAIAAALQQMATPTPAPTAAAATAAAPAAADPTK